MSYCTAVLQVIFTIRYQLLVPSKYTFQIWYINVNTFQIVRNYVFIFLSVLNIFFSLVVPSENMQLLIIISIANLVFSKNAVVKSVGPPLLENSLKMHGFFCKCLILILLVFGSNMKNVCILFYFIHTLIITESVLIKSWQLFHFWSIQLFKRTFEYFNFWWKCNIIK